MSIMMLIFSAVAATPQFTSYAATSADDWPMYRHDSSQTGFSSSSVPTSTVIQLWNYTIDTGALSAPNPPIVVNGRVYVCSKDYGICCFEASDGTRVWSFKTDDEMDYSPAVVDDHIYVGSNDGHVYCLDASSGDQIWNNSVDASMSSSINFADGRVYFGSGRGKLYCLDAASGEELWKFSTGIPEANNNYISYAQAPAISADGYCYVNNINGDVFCLNATSGAHIWNSTVGEGIGWIVAADGRIYFGSRDGNAYCLNASNGAKIWNYTTWYNNAGPAHNYHWGNTVTAAAVANGNVYAGSSDFDVFCLNALTGEKIWNFSTGGIVNAPSVADGCVYAGSYDGNLYCLNASSGAEIWRVAAGIRSPVNAGGSAGSPAVANDVVYVVGNGVLSAWGSPFSDSVFPLSIVILAATITTVALVGVYLYSKHRHSGSSTTSLVTEKLNSRQLSR